MSHIFVVDFGPDSSKEYNLYFKNIDKLEVYLNKKGYNLIPEDEDTFEDVARGKGNWKATFIKSPIDSEFASFFDTKKVNKAYVGYITLED